MFNDAVFTKTMPPAIEDVKVYFSQKGLPEKEAEAFFHFYEKRQWTSRRGIFFKNWKKIAYRWVLSVWELNPWLFNNHQQ